MYCSYKHLQCGVHQQTVVDLVRSVFFKFEPMEFETLLRQLRIEKIKKWKDNTVIKGIQDI